MYSTEHIATSTGTRTERTLPGHLELDGVVLSRGTWKLPYAMKCPDLQDEASLLVVSLVQVSSG